MYTPSAFHIQDEQALRRFISEHSFATLISNGADGLPDVTHLPLLFDRDQQRLKGHMARANPHAAAASGGRACAIFHGPHAYISPAWYETDQAVPTWNYMVVHVRGRLELTPEEGAAGLLKDTVEYFEPADAGWSLEQLDGKMMADLTRGIISFTIEIEEIVGKWKLSQHHSQQRRRRIIDQLRQRDADSPLADAMESLLDE